jgi:hypothetical protein
VTINSVPYGTYELWLVHSEASVVSWAFEPLQRVGAATSVVLDAKHPKVKLELRVPR